MSTFSFSASRLLAPGLVRSAWQPRATLGRATTTTTTITSAANTTTTASAPHRSSILQCTRPFTQSHLARDDRYSNDTPPTTTEEKNTSMEGLARGVLKSAASPKGGARIASAIGFKDKDETREPYHFHIYSHKQNTHVTVTKPNRDVLLTYSTGNLGFKKSHRKSYDAAYQLGAYVIDKMHQKGLVKQIDRMEVVLRGFGQGRDAVVKVLMGNEGKFLRDKITRVSDATRLKIGGTRSPRPRRLG